MSRRHTRGCPGRRRRSSGTVTAVVEVDCNGYTIARRDSRAQDEVPQTRVRAARGSADDRSTGRRGPTPGAVSRVLPVWGGPAPPRHPVRPRSPSVSPVTPSVTPSPAHAERACLHQAHEGAPESPRKSPGPNRHGRNNGFATMPTRRPGTRPGRPEPGGTRDLTRLVERAWRPGLGHLGMNGTHNGKTEATPSPYGSNSPSPDRGPRRDHPPDGSAPPSYPRRGRFMRTATRSAAESRPRHRAGRLRRAAARPAVMTLGPRAVVATGDRLLGR